MKMQERLTFANVVSVLALIVALAGTGGGVAYAHGKIGSAQLKTNAVKSHHIKNGQVKGGDLKSDAVGSGKVKNNSIGSGDLKDNSIGSRDVRNGSLTEADLATSTDGVALAGAAVHLTSVDHQFNRLGGQISLVRVGPGKYDLRVPGARFAEYGQQILASVSNAREAICSVAGRTVADTIQVRCYDSEGAFRDASFQIFLFDDDATTP
ncbi:hypothetical protein KUV85_11910 [Nocardioides panacisoli]|uniref:hypothetical protein n=1 Tax=Nocardioides panacisoli TaxID=627624 RepID=UPI001C638F01|nr:hypothetical protein [Nocardioides panacisoli]QYJ03036.1 hypothetical protein KUV85_11910 [Nocardioides panacisoli]